MKPPAYGPYGLMAEFHDPHVLLEAAERAYAAGYRRMDAYTPIPIEGLAHAIGHHSTRLPWLTLAGALAGGGGGYFMQYYAAAVDYPINVGGRPLHSWPSFIPITFELTILIAAFATVLGMLALNGLPMPYHPVFNVPAFKMASRDRFFLCIEARDPHFDLEQTRAFLQSLQPLDVAEVQP